MRKPNEIIVNEKPLNEILENHNHWLMRDVKGCESMRANLSYADLRHANLGDADLGCANLGDADLRYANLSDADLRYANLIGANLSGANLSYADLRHASLSDADLGCANLSGANLRYASLSDADLSYANLSYADLRDAELRYASLSDAELSYANLSYADLRDAKNIPYIPLECPSEGSFIGWKKIDKILIKLEIPEDARRSSATTKKCRCDKAKVLGFYDLNSTELNIDKIINHRYNTCEYRKGEMVYPDYFDENRWNECSNGIHFFINKQDAINY